MGKWNEKLSGWERKWLTLNQLWMDCVYHDIFFLMCNIVSVRLKVKCVEATAEFAFLFNCFPLNTKSEIIIKAPFEITRQLNGLENYHTFSLHLNWNIVSILTEILRFSFERTEIMLDLLKQKYHDTRSSISDSTLTIFILDHSIINLMQIVRNVEWYRKL